MEMEAKAKVAGRPEREETATGKDLAAAAEAAVGLVVLPYLCLQASPLATVP